MLFAPKEIDNDISVEKIKYTIISQVATFLFKVSLVVIFSGSVVFFAYNELTQAAQASAIVSVGNTPTASPEPSWAATSTLAPSETATLLPSSTSSQTPSATPEPTATERPTKTPQPSSTPTATPDYRATDDANIAAMATQAAKAELREQRVDKLVDGAVIGLYICSGFVGLAIMVAILWIVNDQRPEPEISTLDNAPVDVMVAPLVETNTTDRQIVRDQYFKMPEWAWRDIADELLKGDSGRWGFNYWEEQHRGGPRSEKWFAGNSSDPNKNYRQFQAQLLERGVIAQIGGTDQRPVYGSTVYGRHIAAEINAGNYNIPIPLQPELAPPK